MSQINDSNTSNAESIKFTPNWYFSTLDYDAEICAKLEIIEKKLLVNKSVVVACFGSATRANLMFHSQRYPLELVFVDDLVVFTFSSFFEALINTVFKNPGKLFHLQKCPITIFRTVFEARFPEMEVIEYPYENGEVGGGLIKCLRRGATTTTTTTPTETTAETPNTTIQAKVPEVPLLSPTSISANPQIFCEQMERLQLKKIIEELQKPNVFKYTCQYVSPNNKKHIENFGYEVNDNDVDKTKTTMTWNPCHYVPKTKEQREHFMKLESRQKETLENLFAAMSFEEILVDLEIINNLTESNSTMLRNYGYVRARYEEKKGIYYQWVGSDNIITEHCRVMNDKQLCELKKLFHDQHVYYKIVNDWKFGRRISPQNSKILEGFGYFQDIFDVAGVSSKKTQTLTLDFSIWRPQEQTPEQKMHYDELEQHQYDECVKIVLEKYGSARETMLKFVIHDWKCSRLTKVNETKMAELGYRVDVYSNSDNHNISTMNFAWDGGVSGRS